MGKLGEVCKGMNKERIFVSIDFEGRKKNRSLKITLDNTAG